MNVCRLFELLHWLARDARTLAGASLVDRDFAVESSSDEVSSRHPHLLTHPLYCVTREESASAVRRAANLQRGRQHRAAYHKVAALADTVPPDNRQHSLLTKALALQPPIVLNFLQKALK